MTLIIGPNPTGDLRTSKPTMETRAKGELRREAGLALLYEGVADEGILTRIAQMDY